MSGNHGISGVGKTIYVHSGVSIFDGSPFVSLRWGAESGQLSPLEAEEHGRAIISAAAASRIDAAVYAELTQGLKVSESMAAAFLVGLRKRTGRME